MSLVRQTIGETPRLATLEGPGNGPPLLFLHGVARCASDYHEFATPLTEGWHVRVLDFRGHGHSDRCPGKYRVMDYVDDVLSLVASRPDDPALIYGHSLGAMVALGVAAACPGRVRGLILEDPPFHSMGRRINDTHWPSVFRGYQRIARDGGTEADLTEQLRRLEVSGPHMATTTLGHIRSKESLSFTARCLSLMDPEVMEPVIQGRWLEGYDTVECCRATTCPVLLLQADVSAGGTLSNEEAVELESGLGTCERVFFEGKGHLLHAEHAGEVMPWVRQFVEKHQLNAPVLAARTS